MNDNLCTEKSNWRSDLTRRGFLTLLALTPVVWADPGSRVRMAAGFPRQGQHHRPGRKLIYVVDDVVALTELYALILEPAGYQVRTFNDRMEALEAFLAPGKRPGLLITDFEGYPICVDLLMRCCRKAEPGLKILMASGYPEQYLAGRCVKPDAFLEKPFPPERLLAKVGALL